MPLSARHIYLVNTEGGVQPLSLLVPETGLEPVRCFHHGILSPGRLPVPPLGQIKKPILFALTAVMGLLEAPPGLEPGVKALQASALPLGYGAVYHIICVTTLSRYRIFGAEDEIRTRDICLGKATLYH